jgi:hypothetical protein
MRRTPLALAALAALALAPAAPAADFTLQVPLTISNIPSAATAGLDCSISKVEVAGVSPLAGGNVIGTGSVSQAITGGSFSGVLTVVVNATGIIPPSQAKSYWCSFRITGRATTGATYTASPGNMADVIHTATGQTLTEVRSSISGAITIP